MITLKIANYTTAEMWALKKALSEAEKNLHESQCSVSGHCTECHYKRLCIDYDTAKRTVLLKIRERNLEERENQK